MDQLGRYNRGEMREMVRRRVDAIRNTNISITGEESTDPAEIELDPLVTNQDLNMYLATSLTVRYIDIIGADETTFADETTINIEADKVEYPLPEDLTILRALYWKDPSITGTFVPPNERTFMYEFDGADEDGFSLNMRSIPTYRRRINSIVLNQVPQENNALGIMVDYVKAPLPFLDDSQVLEYQFATILQEVMIIDSVCEIVAQKMQIDMSQLQARATELTGKLVLAARLTKFPKKVQLSNPIPFVVQPRDFQRTGGRFRRW